MRVACGLGNLPGKRCGSGAAPRRTCATTLATKTSRSSVARVAKPREGPQILFPWIYGGGLAKNGWAKVSLHRKEFIECGTQSERKQVQNRNSPRRARHPALGHQRNVFVFRGTNEEYAHPGENPQKEDRPHHRFEEGITRCRHVRGVDHHAPRPFGLAASRTVAKAGHDRPFFQHGLGNWLWCCEADVLQSIRLGWGSSRACCTKHLPLFCFLAGPSGHLAPSSFRTWLRSVPSARAEVV